MMIRFANIFGMLLAAYFSGCASAPETKDDNPVPREATGSGRDCEDPVVIPPMTHMAGIAKEYEWLKSHYPGYVMIEQSLTQCGGSPADELKIRTASGEEKTVTFDISNFYGK